MSKKHLYVTLLLGLLTACGNDTTEKNTVEHTPAASTSDEGPDQDQILLQLSPYIIAEPADQAEREQNAIVDFAIRELLPLERTRTGLFYRVLNPGEGDLLQWGDYVNAHYKGYFLDGELFDDSRRRRDEPMQFYIGNMIPGWNQGLQLIAPGGRIELLVPSALAYGEKGLPDAKGGLLVPADTPLRFEVEVLERLKRANVK